MAAPESHTTQPPKDFHFLESVGGIYSPGDGSGRLSAWELGELRRNNGHDVCGTTSRASTVRETGAKRDLEAGIPS